MPGGNQTNYIIAIEVILVSRFSILDIGCSILVTKYSLLMPKKLMSEL